MTLRKTILSGAIAGTLLVLGLCARGGERVASSSRMGEGQNQPFLNHEPEARASRNARLSRSQPTARLKPTASPRVVRVRDNPCLGGCARASVTKARVPCDTKAVTPCRRSTKMLRALLDFSGNGGENVDPDVPQFDKGACSPFIIGGVKTRHERSMVSHSLRSTPHEADCAFEDGSKTFRDSTGKGNGFSCRPKGVFVTGATTQPRGVGVGAVDDDASQSRKALDKRQRRTRQSRNARCRRARFVVKNGWRGLVPISNLS